MFVCAINQVVTKEINEKIREGGDKLDNIVNAKDDEMTDDMVLDQI